MELLRVHIAELVIADNPATADVATAEAVSDRAAAAGHAIVAREVVADDETAIRAQVARWVADPEVDVVIATGPHESKAAHGALAPLVTKLVPGFTDLFRWLAFQEIGASAMQSTAEAAQCGTTFVFVLPASAKGVRETMDKIINPQLDPKTTPKNLVTEIPRLKPLVDAAEAVALAKLQAEEQAKAISSTTEAVPTAIGPEKTEAGIGGKLRLPAKRLPTSQNVLRKEPPPDVTRQVDRAQLERDLQRAKSNEHDSPTKPSIDLRKLIPAVPPGADELGVGDETDITDILQPQPLARVKFVQATPPGGIPTAPQAGKRKPPTVQIPALPSRQAASEKAAPPPVPTAVRDGEVTPVPSSEPRASRATPPPSPRPDTEPSSPPAMAKAAKPGAKPMPDKPATRPTPPALTPPAGLASPKPRRSEPRDVVSIADLAKVQRDDPEAPTVISKKPADDSRDTAATTARKNRGHADEAPTVIRKPEPREEATTVARKPAARDDEAATVARRPDARDDEAATVARPDASDEAATTPAREEEAPEAAFVVEDERPTQKARPRPPTNPPPARAKRPPTQPPPPPRAQVRLETEELSEDDLVGGGGASAIVAVATGATDVASARAKARRPTEPPPPRQSSDDLPRGKFVYPEHRSATGRILKFGGLAILAAAAGIAFVKFFLMTNPEVATKAPVADAAIATVPVDAAQVVMVEADAAIPEIVIDVPDGPGSNETPGSNASSGRPTAGHPNPGRPNPGRPNPGHPNPGHPNPGHDLDAGVAAPKPDATVAANPIPPSDPTCDEVSCVLEKYARPCCARYKPADPGFKPVGGLPDELDRSMVKSGIENVKPRVIACGEKNAAKGTVKITLTVGPDGAVKDASVADSPAADLGACVATALRSAQFTKTKMGGTFTYPFVF